MCEDGNGNRRIRSTNGSFRAIRDPIWGSPARDVHLLLCYLFNFVGDMGKNGTIPYGATRIHGCRLRSLQLLKKMNEKVDKSNEATEQR